VRLTEKTPLPPPGVKDEVLLANGDRVPGEISDIKENKVQLRVNDVPATLELSRVKAIAFGRFEPPGSSNGLQVALDLGGEDRLTARWLGLEAGNLKLQPLWGGSVEILLHAVSRLEVKNGKLVYLSDLKPAAAAYVPYLGAGDYPPRFNESVTGRPLR